VKTKVPLLLDKRSWKPSPLMGQVVLVTTLNEDGQSNIAPKSWISMMVLEPAILALGCNLTHWTARNAIRTQEFVVNIPGAELAEVVWKSHSLPHPRPVASAGLTPIPAQLVAPPLVEECKAHLECKLQRHLAFGNEVILLGCVVAASIDRAAFDHDDPYSYMRMLAYLENGTFGVIESAKRVTTKPSARGDA